jgi:hypothetical protein
MVGCSNSEDITTQQIKPHTKENAIPYIYNCQVIEKEFVNKGGKISDYNELYLSCSVQDYFIKFCESSVTKKELEPYINKGITVEIEIREGRWDNCSTNLDQVQSRTGTYIIIKAIK